MQDWSCRCVVGGVALFIEASKNIRNKQLLQEDELLIRIAEDRDIETLSRFNVALAWETERKKLLVRFKKDDPKEFQFMTPEHIEHAMEWLDSIGYFE